MSALTMEMQMPEIAVDHTWWGTLAGGLAAGVALLYTMWSKLGLSRTTDAAESDALVALRDAANGWKSLYETSQAQVASERALRGIAEQRASTAVQEVEGLRSEVATLRREIEHLSAVITAYSKGAT